MLKAGFTYMYIVLNKAFDYFYNTFIAARIRKS